MIRMTAQQMAVRSFFLPAIRILMGKGWDGMKGKLWQRISEENARGRRVIFLRRGAVAAVVTVLAVVGIFCTVLFPASTAVSST